MIRRPGAVFTLALVALLAPSVRAAPGFSPSPAARPSSWRMADYDAQATRFNGVERVIGSASVGLLHPVWTVPHVLQAVAIGRLVFAVTNSATAVAVVDGASGKILRTVTLTSLRARGGDRINALAYASGMLLVATALDIFALDPTTGRQVWRLPGGATELVVSGSTIYTGKYCETACGSFAAYAIDLNTGRPLWQHQGNFSDLPVLIAGRLYQRWFTHGGEARIYEPRSGQLVATLPLSARWLGDAHDAYAEVVPRVQGEGGTPQRLSLIRVGPTGKPAWKVDLGPASSSPPVLAYHTLFIPSNRFHPGIIAVDARNGHILWGADIGRDVSLIAANHLIFALHSEVKAVDILDAGSGRLVRRLDLSSARVGTFDSMLIAGGALYLVAGGQGMVALRP